MLRGIPSPSVYGTPSTLCRSCLVQSLAKRRQQVRYASTKFLKRQAEAQEAWLQKAELIKEGKVPHLWDILKERGYVKDIAGTDEQISELMRLRRIGAYVGIDPTAPSLHLGHLLPLMALFWMYIHGHRSISIIGGATAKIGDPTGRLKNRGPITAAEMGRNITKTHYQLKQIWSNLDKQAKRFGYEKEPRVWSRALHNNTIWYSNLQFMEIVTRLFRGVRLSTLLSRETVKNKMEKGDGMSLDELLYPLLQAWDWWMLFKRLGVRMQIGGSDQYGNIVSGVESVKYIRDSEPHEEIRFPNDAFHTPVGFTTPLLTDSAGNKFGKSAGNAVWLDPFMTSPFDLYGYFMRRPDEEVERLLKLFTFIPMEEIKEIMVEHNKDPPKRHAHHKLAFEVLALVHSYEEAENTQNRHKGIFGKAFTEVTKYPSDEPATPALAAAFQTDIKLPESLILGKSISRIIYAAGLADSVSDASRLTQQRGAYVAGAPGTMGDPMSRVLHFGDLTFVPIKNWFPVETRKYLIENKILILRRGKHFVRVIEMVSDEKWKASGLMYPGEPGTGRVRQLQEALKKAAESEGLEADPDTIKQLAGRASLMYKQSSLYEPNRRVLDAAQEEVSKYQVSENRAQTILEYAMTESTKHIQDLGRQTTKNKTDIIDSVIEKTRRELEANLAEGRRLLEAESELPKERPPNAWPDLRNMRGFQIKEPRGLGALDKFDEEGEEHPKVKISKYRSGR